jgi:hypothetical protein
MGRTPRVSSNFSRGRKKPDAEVQAGKTCENSKNLYQFADFTITEWLGFTTIANVQRFYARHGSGAPGLRGEA